MKQLFLILMLVFCTATVEATDTDTSYTSENGQQVFVEYYADGSIKTEGQYDALSNKIGVWYGYYANGSKSVKATFSMDNRHGTWEHYDMEGNLILKLVYKYNKVVEGWMAKDGVLVQYNRDSDFLTRN